MTYDVIPPIAARRVFEAVHWTPAIWWQIERIDVLHPVRREWRDFDGSANAAAGGRVQVVTGVGYVLTARFLMTDFAGPGDNPAQHAATFRRRARSGRFFRQPTLGGPSWPATVRLLPDEEVPRSDLAADPPADLGWMIYDRDPADRDRLRFFRPTMIGGTIDLPLIDVAGLPR